MITFEQVMDFNNILQAHKNANKSKFKYTKQALKFNFNKDINLLQLHEQLYKHKYKFDKYQYMVITDNKRRDIHAPSFKDKIVHHMLNNILLPYVTTRFSKNSYSCIKGRGNLNAVKYLQNILRITKRLYGEEGRYVKIDISKFFYTINREVLKERLTYIIKDENLLKLTYKLIDSFTNESIGLPLGNLTSQLFANIYLDYIDKYITRTLKIKYYMRYADDIFIIVPNKQIANIVKTNIINKLNNKLKLITNPRKCYIQKLNKIHALGYHIHKDFIKLDSRAKKRFKYYLKNKNIKSLNGWYSSACIAKCHSLIEKNINDHGIKFKNKWFEIYNR